MYNGIATPLLGLVTVKPPALFGSAYIILPGFPGSVRFFITLPTG